MKPSPLPITKLTPKQKLQANAEEVRTWPPYLRITLR